MTRTLRYAKLLAVLPWAPLRRLMNASAARMERTVDEVIAARRDGAAPDAPDLLGLMLRTAHPETGRRLDPVNIRRQVITFMVAGHETTSGALSFALYHLTQDEQALAQAQAEVDAL